MVEGRSRCVVLLLPLLSGCIPTRADVELARKASRVANVVSEVSPDCPVESYNGLACCPGVQVATPETGEEVVQLVRFALKKNLKVHAVGNAHTGNDSICPSAGGIALSTEKLRGTIALDEYDGHETVVVDAGITMIELTDWLNQHHLSLGYHVLEFREATIGGVLGTAAHGSALDSSSVVAEDVDSVWVVTSRDLMQDAALTAPVEYRKRDHKEPLKDPSAPGFSGRIQETDDTWKALMTNLGVLGVVTRVRLRVVPQFNLRVAISYHYESALLKDKGVTDMLSDCDFGQLNWFPRYGHVMATCGVATHDYSSPGAANTLLSPRAQVSDVNTFKWFLHNMAKARGATCGSELLRYDQLWLYPPVARTSGTSLKRVQEALGPSHQMMSSSLTKLQRQMPQVDLEIAVPMDRATEILNFVDREVDRLHLCFPLVGIFLRFSEVTHDSLLAHSALPGQRGVMFVEFVMFRPGGSQLTKTDDYFGPYLELAEALIVKYHGRAHWAKNRFEMFALQEASDPDFADRVRRFKVVADQLDPAHMFANAFSSKLHVTQ